MKVFKLVVKDATGAALVPPVERIISSESAQEALQAKFAAEYVGLQVTLTEVASIEAVEVTGPQVPTHKASSMLIDLSPEEAAQAHQIQSLLQIAKDMQAALSLVVMGHALALPWVSLEQDDYQVDILEVSLMRDVVYIHGVNLNWDVITGTGPAPE
jgi:hypothetical protein